MSQRSRWQAKCDEAVTAATPGARPPLRREGLRQRGMPLTVTTFPFFVFFTNDLLCSILTGAALRCARAAVF